MDSEDEEEHFLERRRLKRELDLRTKEPLHGEETLEAPLGVIECLDYTMGGTKRVHESFDSSKD